MDDVVAGLAYFHEGGKTDYLLHPRDRTTGLSYSLLPMIHAIINDMFTPEQAEPTSALIREASARSGRRALCSTGRWPTTAASRTYFQRAESASFFGREIGIMYTHAHLRYCEALARFGDAEGFFHALSQINPIGIRELVPSATLRQANCYYSSSDAAFADRYEACGLRQGEKRRGRAWKAAGESIPAARASARLIMQCFLGLRQEKSALVVDPVIPPALDGLKAEMELEGRRLEITYRIRGQGAGPLAVNLNGDDLPFTREANPYRTGAAEIPMPACGTPPEGATG